MFIECLLCVQHSVGSRHLVAKLPRPWPSQSQSSRKILVVRTVAQCCGAYRLCGRTKQDSHPGFRRLSDGDIFQGEWESAKWKGMGLGEGENVPCTEIALARPWR